MADTISELQWLEHPAGSHFAAGLIALGWAESLDAPAVERRYVCASCRVTPHHTIHRRRQRNRRFRGQTECSQQIVCLAAGQTRDEPGAGRRDQYEVGPSSELDVSHGRLGRRIPQIGGHRATGHGLEGKRRDELSSSRRHYDLNVGAALAQPPYQIGALVGGNAARDTEKNPLALHRGSRSR